MELVSVPDRRGAEEKAVATVRAGSSSVGTSLPLIDATAERGGIEPTAVENVPG